MSYRLTYNSLLFFIGVKENFIKSKVADRKEFSVGGKERKMRMRLILPYGIYAFSAMANNFYVLRKAVTKPLQLNQPPSR